ncbi:MAG TPA: response regulator [Stellaceae bacterium]|nr:response regulator [Stellaceae bacterium]
MPSPPSFSSSDEDRSEAEHLRLAQEAGEIGTWEWDLATGRMIWSAQMFRNLGLEPGQSGDLYPVMVGALHPEDRSDTEAALAKFRSEIGAVRIEPRIIWPSGEIHWLVFLGRTLAGPDGTPNRMLGITIDSTRRRHSEDAARSAQRDSERRLHEMNERLEQLAEERARQLDASRAQVKVIFDNLPDWLTLFRATADGRFVYEDLNHATEIAYGLERNQVVGRPLEEILGAEPAQLPLRLMRACVATGENQHYSVRRTMAGITRSIDVMFARVPEKHDGDWLIMATARDLTEREAIEERLRQSQKMEAVGQLTGGLAHDFNNLLTAVIGNLELLGPRLASDPVATRFLGGAQRAAENGARLTQQLLAFSRRQHLQPRAVDLNGVITGMSDLLARTIGPTIRIETRLVPQLWPARVDPTQIEIAVLNLAINARDAMPLGGTVTIETSCLAAGDPSLPAEIGTRDCVRVSVRDTGTGMTEEVLRSAVEPFFTTKERGKGSGLGLSQVYGMIQQSDGALQIDSRPGVGTEVRLFLPRAAAAEGTDAAPQTQPQERPAGGRILVVDDDAAVREVTVSMLRQIGYGVVETDSGQGALDALARGEVYDLMLIDIAMPGLSGVETARRARERWPGLRVLYVTGFADPSGQIAPETGDTPLIQKPFRFAELREEVQRALKRPPDGARENIVPLKNRNR